MKLPFVEEAFLELEGCIRFYEKERAGYGTLFADEVRRKVARAAKFPRSGIRMTDFSEERDVRLFVLSRVPYTVVTAKLRDEHAVVAIAHQHRVPGYWRSRV